MDASFFGDCCRFLSSPLLRTLALLMPVAGGMVIVAWRYRETSRPITARRIILPPVAMSTGFSMFLVPAFRVSWLQGISAFLVGAAVFFYPLARSSRLTRDGDAIMLRRSPGFLLILLGLLALRIALHSVVGEYVTPRQTGALFFVLAFGMIVRWRWAMLREFRVLNALRLSQV
jgi:membrane protein CcdC involved in cytochrome C biogenesis